MLVQTSYRNRTISLVTIVMIVLKARTLQLLLEMLLVLVVEVEVLVPEVPVRHKSSIVLQPNSSPAGQP